MQRRIPINCILAIDNTFGIGILSNKSYIPWKIKEDMDFFKHTTSNVVDKTKMNAVIMGRNTWDSIPNKFKPLTDRFNVVITNKILENINTFNDPINAINYLNTRNDIESIYIIGGVSLYEQFINSDMLKYLYLTRIDKNYNTNIKVNMNLSNYIKIKEYKQNVIDTNTMEEVSMTVEQYENVNGNDEEMQYLNIMKDIIENGQLKKTRNANTYSLFGKNMTFNLENKTFPLLTTKKVFVKGIFEELLFFLTGKTDTKILENKGVNIWKGNTSEEFLNSLKLNYNVGDMGPMYGFQLLHFNASYTGCDSDYMNKGVNQLEHVLHLLKTDRFSRRILMTTYNPCQAHEGVLYPCHGIVIQFGIEKNNKLCCHMYQRSADWFLGEPFNIASYAFLVYLICELVNNDKTYTDVKLEPGKLIMSFGDVHVYESHLEVVKQQLERQPYKFPKINLKKELTSLEDLETLSYDDIEIIGYKHHPILKASMIA